MLLPGPTADARKGANLPRARVGRPTRRPTQSWGLQTRKAYATCPGVACLLMVRRVSTIAATSASGNT